MAHSVSNARQLPRVVIILAQRAMLGNSSGAEEHNGVLDLLVAKMRERLQIFRENPQAPRVRALEEGLVQIGHRAAAVVGGVVDHSEEAGAPSSCASRFSNCLTVFNNSGSFGNAVMARNQSRLSKAGEPDITAPSFTSPPMPLCA